MIKKALCIGNCKYSDCAELLNPVNDATDISKKLKNLGFKVQILCDYEYKDMDIELNKFQQELESSDVGLFFFAGHGIQIDSENYLAAIDTKFETEINAKHTSLSLNKVINILEKGRNKTSIIILDACRNNPFERRWRGTSRGLAPVFAPKGTIIAFATSPGEVACDGSGSNGSFTEALLIHIETQNLTIEDMFKRVRNTLSASTSGKQTSWEHTSLMGDFFFNSSFVSAGSFITAYAREALADKFYGPILNKELKDFISKLRSHNWYIQNPAIDWMVPQMFNNATKNDLFVVGRNLYQSADGHAISAVNLMKSLASFLIRFKPEVYFHILNGMLYEVYFDSQDRFRPTKKTNCLQYLFMLEEDDRFVLSFEFIQKSLRPYEKELFYLPGTKRHILIDIKLDKLVNQSQVVQNIFFNGDDVFYDHGSGELFSKSGTFLFWDFTFDSFEDDILDKIAATRNRTNFAYSTKNQNAKFVKVPVNFDVIRIAIKQRS